MKNTLALNPQNDRVPVTTSMQSRLAIEKDGHHEHLAQSLGPEGPARHLGGCSWF